MKIYFAADHAGFDLKNTLAEYVSSLGYEVEDLGAHMYDESDDYPEIIARAGKRLSDDALAHKESRAIVLGGSGQGEAMMMNRFKGVRCALFYGGEGMQKDITGASLDMIASLREHNDANALSLGARFLDHTLAKMAIRAFLETPFGGVDRHVRRIAKIDSGMEDVFDVWNSIKKQTQNIIRTRHVSAGDVVSIRLGKNIGFEQDGKGADFLRPVVVLKKYNQYVFTGIPLTTKKKENKYYVDIGRVNELENYAIISQIRMFDTRRVVYAMGHIGKDALSALRNHIQMTILN